MARNRKRAKDRRPRQPQGARVAAGPRPELDPAPGEVQAAPEDLGLPEDAPDPIAHATPDVELAEAQVALGRPELSEGEDASAAAEEAEAEDERESGSPALPVTAGPRPHAGQRLVTFMQGSWHELQRVQWPDRRQVMQATGVVIGFVIVAGAFLGLADLLSGKLINYILTGHFK